MAQPGLRGYIARERYEAKGHWQPLVSVRDTPLLACLRVDETVSIGTCTMAAAKVGVSKDSNHEPFQEHLYKVLVIGDFGVGKLNFCLVRRR